MTPAQAGSDATEQNPAHGRAYGEPWDAVGEDSDREGVIAFVERSSHLGPQEQSIESGELGDHIFFSEQNCHQYIHITFTMQSSFEARRGIGASGMAGQGRH